MLKSFMFSAIILICCVSISFSQQCECTTTGDNTISAPNAGGDPIVVGSSWSCVSISGGACGSSVPSPGDYLIVANGHTLTIEGRVNWNDANTSSADPAGASPVSLIIESGGNLLFGSGGNNRLYFPTGSYFELEPSSDADGNAGSEELIIGGTIVVDCAGAGCPLNGPFTFGTPLPVELIHFQASCSQSQILLKWQTAQEFNNEYFEVQRSSDGWNFEAIETIAGAGNSEEPIEYEYIDAEAGNGAFYYRLKQR